MKLKRYKKVINFWLKCLLTKNKLDEIENSLKIQLRAKNCELSYFKYMIDI